MNDPLILTETGGSDTTSFRLKSNQGYDTYELGSWKYVLDKVNNTDGSSGWYLVNDDLSSLGYSVVDSIIVPDIWYLETNALYNRVIGDELSRDETGGNGLRTWAQLVYNKAEYENAVETKGAAGESGFTISGPNKVTQEFKGVSAGMDKKVRSTENYDLYGGMMFGYGEGDLDRDYGDSDNSSLFAGLYGIWRFHSGWYLAGLLKYNRYEMDVTVCPVGYGGFKSDYSQDGFGVGAMLGRKFERADGWYLEPQVEMGWHRIEGTDYTIGGLPVEVGSMTSLRGRAGLKIGRNWVYENGRTLDLFARASLIHEFDGEADINIYSDASKSSYDPFTADYSGTWGQYKVGIASRGKDFDAYAAFTYEDGDGRESPVGVEAGLKWYVGPKP